MNGTLSDSFERWHTFAIKSYIFFASLNLPSALRNNHLAAAFRETLAEQAHAEILG